MKELLQSLKALVARERELNIEILRKLREVDESRLFARMGYSSLHAFCVRELGYSEAAADRRVQAMRLIRDEPAVERKLATGELNLTTAADLSRTFREAEKQDVELPKAEIIEAACGKTSREAEKEIRKCAAAAGVVAHDDDAEFEEELKAVLAKFSHAHPGLTEKKLFRLLVKKEAKLIDPERPRRRSGAGGEQDPVQRRVSEPLRREVVKRDEGNCSYVSEDGRRCGATHFLEVDHIVPVAKGGLTKLSNLRLLCRTHNRLAAEDAGLRMRHSGAGAARAPTRKRLPPRARPPKKSAGPASRHPRYEIKSSYLSA